tara:strand:- start:3303 stop:3749 length:447 start_codon:yes stop_codon:yes gene_type:complete
MYLSDFIILSYPIVQTHYILKYPRLKKIKHWLIFWYIWICLEIIETVSFGFIPFWGLVKPIVILINYKISVTEFSHKMINIAIRHIYIKVKNIDDPLANRILNIKFFFISDSINHWLDHPVVDLIINNFIGNTKNNDKSIKEKKLKIS